MKIVNTDKAPKSIGPYSQGIISQGFLYTSGQAGLNKDTGKLAEGGIREQAEQAIQNLCTVAEAAGTDLAHTVKATCFLVNMSDFAEFNKVYSKYFVSNPARSCVAVKTLPLNALCEIEIVVEI